MRGESGYRSEVNLLGRDEAEAFVAMGESGNKVDIDKSDNNRKDENREVNVDG